MIGHRRALSACCGIARRRPRKRETRDPDREPDLPRRRWGAGPPALLRPDGLRPHGCRDQPGGRRRRSSGIPGAVVRTVPRARRSSSSSNTDPMACEPVSGEATAKVHIHCADIRRSQCVTSRGPIRTQRRASSVRLSFTPSARAPAPPGRSIVLSAPTQSSRTSRLQRRLGPPGVTVQSFATFRSRRSVRACRARRRSQRVFDFIKRGIAPRSWVLIPTGDFRPAVHLEAFSMRPPRKTARIS